MPDPLIRWGITYDSLQGHAVLILRDGTGAEIPLPNAGTPEGIAMEHMLLTMTKAMCRERFPLAADIWEHLEDDADAS